MNRSVFLVPVVLVFSLLVSQAADSSCCTMKIDASSAATGVLTVTIVNIKQQVITIQKTTAEMDYTVQLTSANGAPCPQSEDGRKLLTKERGGRRSYEELHQNESTSDTVDLRKLFELTSGAYRATVTRRVTIGGSIVVLEATAAFEVP